VTAAEVVRRVAEYQPKARILDEWRRYVSELELAPELEAALVDPDRVLEAVRHLEPLGFARLAHACTHTTFSPNVVQGGSKINVIPDRIAIDVDVRALPGVAPLDVDAMLKEALGDMASRVEIEAPRGQEGSRTPFDTPLADALSRVTQALVPGSKIIPRLTGGGTDARYFRWKGVPSYGFALHSRRIPYTEYPLMFHGNNERVDTDAAALGDHVGSALPRFPGLSGRGAALAGGAAALGPGGRRHGRLARHRPGHRAEARAGRRPLRDQLSPPGRRGA